MSNKYNLGMLASVIMFATSCSNEVQIHPEEYAEVSISLGIEELASARSISDGQSADKLIYAVFDAEGKRIQGLEQVTETDVTFPTTKTITLAKGQTYKVAFWAQDADCNAYIVSDDMNVSINYEGAKNNDETRDAFFSTTKPFTVNGSTYLDVELKRPFAQINVGVDAADWNAAIATGVEITESNVTIQNAATTIDLLTGKVSGSKQVNYTTAAIPKEVLQTKTHGDYKWLSMSYILVNDGENSTDGNGPSTLTSLAYTFTAGTGESIVFSEGLNGVPVQRNYRTNILGQILTSDIDFNISIYPIFDGETNYPETLLQQLEFAATFGGEVVLTENVTLTEPLKVASDMKLNLNGHTIKGGKEDSPAMTGTDIAAITVDNGANLVISGEGTIEGTEYGVYVKNGIVSIKGGDIKAGTSAVQVYNGTANIEGGNFSATKTNTYVINCIDANWKNGTAKINITGGTFKDFNPGANEAEGAGTDFVPEGYSSLPDGDWFKVVEGNYFVVENKEYLIDAIKNTGDVNIYLTNDIEFDSQLNIIAGSEIYLDMNGKKITSSASPVFKVFEGATLVIDGNGTVETPTPASMLFTPLGNLVIENGTFIRKKPEGYTGGTSVMFQGTRPAGGWHSTGVIINGGYFDSAYYDKNAEDIDDYLDGTKTLVETDDDISKRGKSGDKNKTRVALKNNVMAMFNKSYNYFHIFGGTFVGANPAWGDEGGWLPIKPQYLRPWSNYQGAFIEGQEYHEDGIVLPEGYTITKGTHEDGRPTYTVTYNK